MNESDPLETELAAMRPRDPSPYLKQRIADKLTPDSPVAVRRPWRSWGRAGALAISCAGVLSMLLWRGRDPVYEPDVPPVRQQPLVASEFDDKYPSVWSYHKALDQSAESLNALLNQHTTSAFESNPEGARVDVLTLLKSEQNFYLGEL